MSDRLNELRRQRALLQQHLDWLDREINREAGPATPVVSSPSTPTSPQDVTTATPEAMPGDFIPDPESAGRQARLGCWLYLVAAFALLGAILLAIYWTNYRDRPLFLMDRNTPAETR
jgi:hypothetical protein